MRPPPDDRSKPLTPEEFVGLLLAHDGRIRAFVMTLMLATSDVDDVHQNACMAAFRKLATFTYQGDRPDEEFVRWICTVAKYEVLQFYRSRRRDRVAFSSDLVADLAEMQLQETRPIRLREEALKDCLEGLSDKEKTLVRMRYGDAIPVATMAQRIGRTANGVYKALARIRARLMQCVQLKIEAEGRA